MNSFQNRYEKNHPMHIKVQLLKTKRKVLFLGVIREKAYTGDKNAGYLTEVNGKTFKGQKSSLEKFIRHEYKVRQKQHKVWDA